MSAETFIRNEAYEQRVREIVMTALMLGLKDEETGVCVWRTGEIINVFSHLTAMLLAGSQLATPTRLREFCHDYAKQLQRRTVGYQKHNAEHGAPFPSYIVEGDMH